MFTKFWFISIIYLRSIFFELFVLLIFMFFGQVSHTTISFTWWIVITMSLLISITFVVYLMSKWWRFLFSTTFFTSVKVISFFLFLGLTGSLIGFFLMIVVSGVFFILLLRGIWRISGAELDKLSPCIYKTETLKLSLWISISEGFSILLLLLDKLVLVIYLYLSTVFSVSVLWVDLYLSIDLTLSVLLLMVVSTILFDAFDFSIFLLCQYSSFLK